MKTDKSFAKLAKEYDASKHMFANNVEKETLTQNQHKVIIEELCSEELSKLYNDVAEIERCDLLDYFELERRYARN